jgi:hypothetical protein
MEIAMRMKACVSADHGEQACRIFDVNDERDSTRAVLGLIGALADKISDTTESVEFEFTKVEGSAPKSKHIQKV